MPGATLRSRPRRIVAIPADEPPRLATLYLKSFTPVQMEASSGQTYQLDVGGKDQRGDDIDLTHYNLQYQSTLPNRAAVNSTGLVTAGAASGDADIIVTPSPLNGVTPLDLPIVITSVAVPTPDGGTVSPSAVTVQVGGGTAQVSVAFTQAGAPMTGRTVDVTNHQSSKCSVSSQTLQEPFHLYTITPVADSSGALVAAVDFVDHASGFALHLTVTVLAAVGGQTTPDYTIDFNVADTPALLQNSLTQPGSIWSGSEDGDNAGHIDHTTGAAGLAPIAGWITLRNVGPPGFPIQKSMGYEWRNRLADGPSLYCHDKTIARRAKFDVMGLGATPGGLPTEIFAESRHRFSSNWDLNHLPACTGPGLQSTNGYKFIFFLVLPSAARFHVILWPTHFEVAYPWKNAANPPVNTSKTQDVSWPVQANLFNNTWFTWRWRAKVGSNPATPGLLPGDPGAGNDAWAFQILDMAGNVLFTLNWTGLTTYRTNLSALEYGANINEGPIVDTQLLDHSLTTFYKARPAGWTI